MNLAPLGGLRNDPSVINFKCDNNKVYFRMVNERCNPEIVGSGNAGKHCTVIIGHKEVERVHKVKEMRGVEEFSGVSVRISKQDDGLYLSYRFNWKTVLCRRWECRKRGYSNSSFRRIIKSFLFFIYLSFLIWVEKLSWQPPDQLVIIL